MRVHAIESSGSMYVYIQKVFCALQRHGRPDDFVLIFGKKIEQVVKLKTLMAEGHGSLNIGPAGGTTHIQPVMDWMDNRFLLPTDELIIYSDFYVDDMPREDRYYNVKFVDLVNNPPGIFPSDKVYRVGEYEEGYRLIKKTG